MRPNDVKPRRSRDMIQSGTTISHGSLIGYQTSRASCQQRCANAYAIHMNCQRRILGIRWFHFVTNASVTSQTAVAARRGGGGSRGTCPKHWAPVVPRQLSYSDVDHKRISWLRATDYFEDVNYDVINHAE